MESVSALHTGYNFSTEIENVQFFFTITLAISRITEPRLGLFVLILMHFSC